MIIFVVGKKAKVLIFFSFYKLNECVKTKMEKKRAEVVTLKDTVANRDSGGLKFICDDRSLEIQIYGRAFI